MSRKAEIEQLFPNLCGTSWAIKSRRTKRYNCLAWGAGEKHRRWDYNIPWFWPPGVSRLPGIAYLVGAYQVFGFVVCNQNQCLKYDPICDTIVLYELNCYGTHAARLVHNEMWSSKLGDLEDIQHETPEALSGSLYGNPAVYMKRPKAGLTRKGRAKP
jgi:hypothetical protein